MSHPVYALNLFNVSNRDEYLAYSRRSVREVQTHGGRVVALGKFREAVVGELEPRPTCTRIASTAPRTTSGTSSTSWKISGPS